MKKNKSKYNVSIVSHNEIESGEYFKLENIARRNLRVYLRAIVEDYVEKTKQNINKIIIERKNGKIEISITEEIELTD